METYKNGEKAGKEKDISFASVCSGFAHKFFPDIIKGKSKQEMSFKEKMLAKHKK